MSLSWILYAANLWQAIYFQFKITPAADENDESCPHVLCPSCFGKIQADRSSNLHIQSPARSCHRSCREWSVHQYTTRQGYAAALTQRVSLPVEGLRNKKKHPTQFFSNLGRDYRRNHAILSVSTINPDDSRITNTYVIELNVDSTKNTPRDTGELKQIG